MRRRKYLNLFAMLMADSDGKDRGARLQAPDGAPNAVSRSRFSNVGSSSISGTLNRIKAQPQMSAASRISCRLARPCSILVDLDNEPPV